MKVFKFMATNYIKFFILMLIAIVFNSCKSNDCVCEDYAIPMSRITISVKSLDEDDIEIRCVGRYCCSREKGQNDWTIIRKDYAEIIESYNKLNNPDTNYSKEIDSIYYLGFVGLSLHLINIENIEYLTTVEHIIDSFAKISDKIRHDVIYFDEYPNNLGLEFRGENGFFVKNFVFNKAEDY